MCQITTVVNHVADICGESKVIESKGGNIDKLINVLREAYGIPIKLNKEANKKLNMMREERNRFVHQISRDLPEDLKRYYDELLGTTERKEGNHEFVYHAFQVTHEVAKVVTVKYIDWLDKQS